MGNADVRKNSTDNFNNLADRLVAGMETPLKKKINVLVLQRSLDQF